MVATYRVGRHDASAVGNILLRIWSANLTPRANPRDKLQWYQDAPAGSTTVFLLECDTPGGAGTYVGSGGLRLREFTRGKGRLKAALFADLAVQKEHRTVRPVLILQRAIREYTRQHFHFAYGFPNRSAVGVYRRLGYHDLGLFPVYVRVLRHAFYLRRRLKIAALAGVAGAVLDGLFALPRFIRPGGSPASLKLEWLRDVDERFDALGEECGRQWPLLGERGAQFLRWRFLEKPGPPCEIAALVERDTAVLRAYAIVRRQGDGSGPAQVLDLLGATEHELDHLLRLLTRGLRDRGAAAISLRFFGTGRIERLLKAHGFRRRVAAKPTWVVVDVGEEGRDDAQLRDAEIWYLTEADRDN